MVAAPVTSLAQTAGSLTTEQQSQVDTLSAKLLALAKSQSEAASEGAFTGLFVDATAGFSPVVIEAAMARVAGTPGLPQSAIRSATNLRRAYASNGSTGATGSVGGFGGLPSSSPPSFGGGGGGSGYTGQ